MTPGIASAAILYLFDIDGTLLHAHGSGREAFDAVLAAQHGLANASEGVRYGGKTDPGIIDEIFVARLGRMATTDEHAAFLAAYETELRAMLAANGVQVLAGVVHTLRYLSACGNVKLGVATGNVRAGAIAKLEAAELDAWFASHAIGGYGSDSAIRAELVAAAIVRAQPVDHVVVVGDTIHDIAAARANGAIACAVATGADPADKLGHADVVLASMTELPTWHAARFR